MDEKCIVVSPDGERLRQWGGIIAATLAPLYLGSGGVLTAIDPDQGLALPSWSAPESSPVRQVRVELKTGMDQLTLMLRVAPENLAELVSVNPWCWATPLSAKPWHVASVYGELRKDLGLPGVSRAFLHIFLRGAELMHVFAEHPWRGAPTPFADERFVEAAIDMTSEHLLREAREGVQSPHIVAAAAA